MHRSDATPDGSPIQGQNAAQGTGDDSEVDPSSLGPQAPVRALPGIGEKRAVLLTALNIHTVLDLLLYLPREHRDRSRIAPIAEAAPGREVTIAARVERARNMRLPGRKSMALLTVTDGAGVIKVSFFGRGFLARSVFKPGNRFLFTGKVSEYAGPILQNPEYEPIVDGEEDARLHTGRLTPLYPLIEGLNQRQLRRWVWQALEWIKDPIPDPVPEQLRRRHGLPSLSEALRQVHFPDSVSRMEDARRRFAYEELLRMQVGIFAHRHARREHGGGIPHRIAGPSLAKLRASIPFSLTRGQERAVEDILGDMGAAKPMFRLLQGDVGCGKTLVIMHAIAAAIDSGRQAAFMAPTEVLAEQHFITLHAFMESLGANAGLLTGSASCAAEVRARIADGSTQVVIGTHALFQQATRFGNLGLVIIDEQHRFGVRQRDLLARKGDYPDVLHTTATPIPRTLAITLYGGMDITVIPDMPPGRKPVMTRQIPDSKLEDLYRYTRQRVLDGEQAYIVCPLVDESEFRPDLKPLTAHYETLSRGVLNGLRTAFLHGRMAAEEKECLMHRFKAGDIQVLFSTTVIEVGVDAPGATIMIIEDAARFGLPQLHQLRGRVGRSAAQSWCFLTGKSGNAEARERLERFCRCTDGFEIAEADLHIRGPGDCYGLRQAGAARLRAADLLRDVRLLDEARRDAAALVAADPKLSDPDNRLLADALHNTERMFV